MTDIYVQAVDTSDSLIHYGVVGMKWGVRKDKRPANYTYKARKTSIAKPGLEDAISRYSMPRVTSITRNGKTTFSYGNATNTSKVRAKVSKKVTKDKELRKLNKEYVDISRKKGELSKEAKEAKQAFQQRGQDLAVKYVKQYQKAYLKDAQIKNLSKKEKLNLDEQIMNSVYIGPSNWYGDKSKEVKDFAKVRGVPTRL